jgi:CubicO group peptidase (beta-lactamase class C family)
MTSNRFFSFGLSRLLVFSALVFVALLPLAAAAADNVARGVQFAKPEQVGMSSERLARLDKFLQEKVDQKRVAGLVALVARRGKIVHFKAYGMADIESGVKMRTDHLFRLTSQTKPITSTALLMLYEQGKFQLTDPLEKYIPAFKDVKVFAGLDANNKMILQEPKRKITIQDVFRHTAGFSDIQIPIGNPKHPVEKAYLDAGLNWMNVNSLNSLDLVNKIAGMPLLYHPGERWVYSVAHDVQAYLVEYFSGMPFEEFVYKNLTRPLSMKDTVFGVPKEYASRFAKVYGPGKFLSPLFSGKPYGGGGLSCTAMDYYLFSQMLMNGGKLGNVRILGKKTVELMTSNNLPSSIPYILDDPGAGYGLGVGVLLDPAQSGQIGSKGAFGWGGAAMTMAKIDPKEELVWGFYAQQLPGDEFGLQFPILVYQAIID